MAELLPVIGGSFSGIATTTYGTIGPLLGRSKLTFIITGFGAETMGVTLSNDGVTYGAVIKVIDLATQAASAATTLSNGSFALNAGPLQYVKLTKSAGADTPVTQWIAAP